MGLTGLFKSAKKDDIVEAEKSTSPLPTAKDDVVEAEKSTSLLPTPQDAPAGAQRPLSLSQMSRNSYLGGTPSVADETKHHLLLSHIYQQQLLRMWITDTTGEIEGVMIRTNRHDFIFDPPELANSRLAYVMAVLNVQAALTVNSKVIEPFCTYGSVTEVPISNELRIQILPDIDDLFRARRHQYAAFIASEAILVVWDDDSRHLLQRTSSIIEELVRFTWTQGVTDEYKEDDKSDADEETGSLGVVERPIRYYHCILIAFAICLVTVLESLGAVNIANDIVQLHRWSSLAFLSMIPINVFMSLFFASVCISVVAQIIGPIGHVTQNSKYYSALPPPRLYAQTLPHVTFQMPVYKEGLASVIAPTIKSIKVAISTYELQGGSANIFVNDDGLQILSEAERQARVEFYEDHGIGWTARPGHNDDGFIRKGKFKKASNMNYGLSLSNKVEDRLYQVERTDLWTQSDEVLAYERSLIDVLAEDGRAWADGNIRIGDYIILIDSDTRVPTDCLLDAVSEMEESPNVAIIQFSSGVMQVAHNYFENGITFFTNLIYSSIRFGVSAGDVAPFVGHNAILRWSAIQEVSFIDVDDKEKFWSESHVSEDFDMALRLQVLGYVIRFAAWAGEGFKEGVSLTVYDELTRWEKYAYGCNELVFNPIRTWPWRGPFTALFRRFLTSGIPIGSKISITSYIGTYYALGASWIFTVANYVALGLFNGYLDKWYLDSWKIFLSVVVVFVLCSNIALAFQRYRLNQRSFIGAFVENFKWCFMFVIFFGGISLHISQALLCHMLEIDMQWGATAKELEFANFFTEVPKIGKKFKYSMTFSLLLIVGIIIMAEAPFIPWSWNIDLFVAVFPLVMMCSCTLLLPIVLNPGLMTFFW